LRYAQTRCWITQTQLNSTATKSRALYLVTAYGSDLVTEAPDS
jgi:hypothetical protein